MLALALCLEACVLDDQDVAIPAISPCDSTGVSFQIEVMPMIVENCQDCHNHTSAIGNVILESYHDVSRYAFSGSLVFVLEYNSRIKMPPSGKLPICKIAQVRNWVAEGVLDH